MLIWEEVKQDTGGTLQRVKVPNGWLVKETHEVYLSMKNGSFITENNGHTWTSSLAFIPDADHRWEIYNI